MRVAQVGAGDALQLAEIVDVLAGGEARIEARLIGQHAEPQPRALRIGHRIDIVHDDLPFVRPHQRVEHAQRRGLAGAVRAEQARDLAVGGGEA